MNTSEALITRRGLLAGATAFFAVSSALVPARAETLTAEEFAARLGTWVVRLAASGHDDATLRRQFAELFSRHVDVDAVARFALGRFARRMPRQMRREYRDLVLDYIAGLFVEHRRRLAALEVRPQQARRRGRWVVVKTTVVYHDGRTIPVHWRLAQKGSRYQVADVNLHNIWLSMRMRERFVAFLDRHGGDFAALLQGLRQHAV